MQGKFCSNCGSYQPVVGYYVHHDTVAYVSCICPTCWWDANEPEYMVYHPFSKVGAQFTYAVDTLKRQVRRYAGETVETLCDSTVLWCFK